MRVDSLLLLVASLVVFFFHPSRGPSRMFELSEDSSLVQSVDDKSGVTAQKNDVDEKTKV